MFIHEHAYQSITMNLWYGEYPAIQPMDGGLLESNVLVSDAPSTLPGPAVIGWEGRRSVGSLWTFGLLAGRFDPDDSGRLHAIVKYSQQANQWVRSSVALNGEPAAEGIDERLARWILKYATDHAFVLGSGRITVDRGYQCEVGGPPGLYEYGMTWLAAMLRRPPTANSIEDITREYQIILEQHLERIRSGLIIDNPRW